VGAVRHRQLVQLLATFVALDMAVGVVALSARRGDRETSRAALVAGSVSIPLNDGSGTGVLAGANLKKRRASTSVAVARGSVEAAPATSPSSTVAPASPAPATASSTAADRTASGGGVEVGPSSKAPGTTGAPTRPSGSTTSGDSGGTARSSGSTSTSRSGPTGSTPATRSSSDGGATSETGPDEPSAPADDTSATSPQDGAATAVTTTTRPAATPTTAQPPAAGPARSEVTVADATGDTFVDGTRAAIQEPRADIVKAGAAYRSGILAFVMQVQQPVDPRTDERWASDGTFALWSVDTNGDGQPDFDIQYYGGGSQLGGSVSKSNSTDVVCDIEAAYGSEGYSAIVDPACLGNPASVAFRLTMYYDTNPKDDNGDVASDVTPNGGMSMPVSRPS